MKECPLVTVLMPCYNAMPFLIEALDSITNQTYTNLEILCINDGSTDDTGQVLEQYASQDNRIRVIHNEKNIKLIATLNKGIDLANGKYIARMDADDVSHLLRIEKSVDALENDSTIDLVSVSSSSISESGEFINQEISRCYGILSVYFSSFLFNPVGNGQITCKAGLLKENKYLFDEKTLHTEDYEIWARVLNQKHKLVNLKEDLYKVRINSNSVSRKYTELQDANFVFQANQFYNRYTNKQLPINLSKVITNRVDKTIVISEFSQALKELKWFKSFFLNKENVDSVDLREIKTVYKTHLFDICFQTLKRASIHLKIYCFPYLLYYTAISLFSKEGRAYLVSKRKR